MAIDPAEFVRSLSVSVRYVAKRVGRKCRPHVDADDLAQEGLLAVYLMAKDYDPARAKPWAFVRRRVYGAMVDYIRSRVNEFGTNHAKRVGRGDKLPRVFHMSDGVHFLDERRGREPEFLGADDPEVTDPPREEFLAAVRSYGASVDALDAQILEDLLVDDQTMKRIGAARGLSESRVSQRCSRIIADIREHLGIAHVRQPADPGSDPAAAT